AGAGARRSNVSIPPVWAGIAPAGQDGHVGHLASRQPKMAQLDKWKSVNEVIRAGHQLNDVASRRLAQACNEATPGCFSLPLDRITVCPFRQFAEKFPKISIFN